VAALVGVALVSTAGGLVALPTEGQTMGGPASVTVAVIQGDVPQAGMDAFGDQRAVVLGNHVRETERLAADVRAGTAARPDLVVWPENASDLDPFRDDDARAQIQQAVDAIDVPVLVGAVVQAPDDPTHVWNTGIVWMPSTSPQPGPGDYYVKQHPVPFGEWVPARTVLAKLISRFDQVPRDFAAGVSTGVLMVGPARLGDLICFEVSYDELGRAAVRGDGVHGELEGLGGRILAVQTNNATYGRTGQPEQQLAMSQLRAVEHGRAILIAATSGISAIVRPDGSISQSLPEFTAGYLVEKVPLRDDLTISDRVGAVPELVGVGVMLVLLVLALRGRRRPGDIGSAPSLTSEESVL
jgi:apolipoprotein N-acyltransferase